MAGFKIDKRAIAKMQKEIVKEFERANRKHPVRIPIEVEPPSMGMLTLASASGLESDPQLSRLLLWLYDSVQQNPSHYVDVRVFARDEGLPEDDSDNMALQLEKLGLVKIARSLAGGLSDVFPTDDGLLEARLLLALRTDAVERFGHACDVLLRWVLRVGGRQASVPALAFLQDPLCSFAGEPLTEAEVLSALDYLREHALVERVVTDAEVAVLITAQGTRCVLAGGTVNDFLSRQPTGGDTYNITGSHGFVAGSQQHVVQNNSFGLDASKLAEFAQQVRQFAPSLGISAEEQDQLILDAEVLEEAATTDEPEPGRVRAAFDRLNATLTAIGTATPGLTMLVGAGQSAYQAVFGA
ncbi:MULTISPECIES: hypothetical protein [Streptomyces]|uniref:Uncharacterized protein n=1 Tax=Streptomyces griseus TaxID=1911 RepID=A0A380NZS4_STRGR|nr:MULTISPECIES: hypothetical protein [Streptomyces]WPR51859.1 hypothetical protein SJI45_13280 [Streptomyces sp. S399]SUP57721.1 Uncharacterised protein [Streptomyces griseus]